MNISHLLVAALAFAVIPGRAAADDTSTSGSQSSCPQPGAPGCPGYGTGGSASDQSALPPSGSSTSDQATTPPSGSTTSPSGEAAAPPPSTGAPSSGEATTPPPSTGGSAAGEATTPPPSTGGTGEMAAPPSAVTPPEQAVPPAATGQEQTVVVAGPPCPAPQKKAPSAGVTLSALGGVESYTGPLAARIDPGVGYGVNLTMQRKILGMELAYSGATNVIGEGGGRLMRNGANVDAKVTLYPGVVEPFVYGGVGVSRATFSGLPAETAFHADTFGQVPLGAGLVFHIGAFTAGARLAYNFLFDQQFTDVSSTAAVLGLSVPSSNLWNGEVQLGGRF